MRNEAKRFEIQDNRSKDPRKKSEVTYEAHGTLEAALRQMKWYDSAVWILDTKTNTIYNKAGQAI